MEKVYWNIFNIEVPRKGILSELRTLNSEKFLYYSSDLLFLAVGNLTLAWPSFKLSGTTIIKRYFLTLNFSLSLHLSLSLLLPAHFRCEGYENAAKLRQIRIVSLSFFALLQQQ